MVVRGVIRRKGRIDLAQASENVLIRLHHSTPPVAPWLRQKSSAKTGWVARSKLRGNLDSRHPQGFCRVTRLPVNAALRGVIGRESLAFRHAIRHWLNGSNR